LNGMRTNATTDAGQRIGVAGKTIGLFKTAFRDQTNIAPGIGMGRAGHHAGKVGIKPISVDLLILIALQHGAMPLLQLEESSGSGGGGRSRSEEHTSELQSRENLVCRLLLEKKKKTKQNVQKLHT